MQTQQRFDEMTAAQLSERAEGYAALAKDKSRIENRETFIHLAELCTNLAGERKVEEDWVRRLVAYH